jgi:hypothetical protein
MRRPRPWTKLPYLGSSLALKGKYEFLILRSHSDLVVQFPIVKSTHHLLPSPNGELAPAISAVIDAWGTQVHVVVSHNGQEEDPLDRQLQSKRLAEIMDYDYPEPTIFLGMSTVTTRRLDHLETVYRIRRDQTVCRASCVAFFSNTLAKMLIYTFTAAPYLYLTEDARM